MDIYDRYPENKSLNISYNLKKYKKSKGLKNK